MSVRQYAAALAKRPRRRLRQPEAREQAEVIAWARASYAYNPVKWVDLDLLHCSLNGMPMTPAQAARCKAQGMRAGILDLQLPVPRGGWFGLWVEMKAGKNGLTKEQKDVSARLTANGYRVHTCWSAAEAIAAICAYYEATNAEPSA